MNKELKIKRSFYYQWNPMLEEKIFTIDWKGKEINFSIIRFKKTGKYSSGDTWTYKFPEVSLNLIGLQVDIKKYSGYDAFEKEKIILENE
jgi:hypothetical protein